MITSTNGSIELMIAEPLLPLLLNSSSSFYQPSSGDSVKEFQCQSIDPINEQMKLSNQSIEYSPSNKSVSNIPVRFVSPEREREMNFLFFHLTFIDQNQLFFFKGHDYR